MASVRQCPDSLKYFDELPASAYVDAKTLCALAAISKSSLWRAVAAGRLARPRSFGERTSRWSVADVRRFLSGAAATAPQGGAAQ
jgi:predicted DNA-binding transcriptional regulator AlpA